ncbi:MAG TPA: CBS domain-containing protein [Chloroflexi bacterium]|nr:CBS domain-containing protein [Chloroflexota bacterium]
MDKLEKYLVKDWMTPDPITITSQTTVLEAEQVIRRHRIRRLPVVDDGKLVGIVSWGDVREALPSDITSLSTVDIYHMLSYMPVSEIMSANVITIGPEEPIGKAAWLMTEYRISSLPVMDGERLVGIISATDLLRLLTELTGYKEEEQSEAA